MTKCAVFTQTTICFVIKHKVFLFENPQAENFRMLARIQSGNMELLYIQTGSLEVCSTNQIAGILAYFNDEGEDGVNIILTYQITGI